MRKRIPAVVSLSIAVLQISLLIGCELVSSLITAKPLADAGFDITDAVVDVAVLLDGNASTGADEYLWSFVMVAPGSSRSSTDIINRTKASASFTPDAPGSYIVDLTVTNAAGSDSAVLTITAISAADTVYTITFNSQGATVGASPSSISITSPATTISALPTEPSKANYAFGGWFSAPDGGGNEFTVNTTVTSNITVYAKWTLIPNNPPTAPTSPSPAHLATAQPLSLAFSWAASTDPDAGDSVSYDVYLGTANPPATKANTVPLSVTTYSASALSGSSDYYWQVWANDTHGGTTKSAVWRFTTVPATTTNTLPTTPTSPSPTDLATAQPLSLTLSWSASTDSDAGDSVSYDVYIGTVNPPATKANMVPLSVTSYSASGLSNSSDYYWQVWANDTHGGTTKSAIWRFTTVPATTTNTLPTAPTSPSPAHLATAQPLSLTLSWAASTDPDAGDSVSYDVYLGTVNPPATKANTVPLSVTTYSASALSGSSDYYWQIWANDTHGGTTKSAVWRFTTQTVLDPVSPVNASLTTHGLSLRVVSIIPSGSVGTFRSMSLTAYAMGDAEVTQGDYASVMGSNPASASTYGVGANYPVHWLPWTSAALFCNTLSTLCGLQPVYNSTTWAADFTKNGFYLPTEAQWEYAAGGPGHTIWSLGDSFDPLKYVYNRSLAEGSMPVKSKNANGFGLYDMSGNEWEWCHDWYGGIYPDTTQPDPNGPASGSARVIHGGGWDNNETTSLRCDSRGNIVPSIPHGNLGFRVAVGGHGLWQ